jgi:hypothetical protein
VPSGTAPPRVNGTGGFERWNGATDGSGVTEVQIPPGRSRPIRTRVGAILSPEYGRSDAVLGELKTFRRSFRYLYL